jgi:hypothetical protein
MRRAGGGKKCPESAPCGRRPGTFASSGAILSTMGTSSRRTAGLTHHPDRACTRQFAMLESQSVQNLPPLGRLATGELTRDPQELSIVASGDVRPRTRTRFT